MVEGALFTDADIDETIAREAEKTKKQGYRYLSFMHPGVGKKDFRAIVSLHPQEDLAIIGCEYTISGGQRDNIGDESMRSSGFAIDFLDGQVFQGYTKGENWNGFACPYFTHEQAQRLAEAWRATGREVRYDADADQFTFEVDAGEGREYESFPAIKLDGAKLYPIGNGCWIWEEVVQEGVGL